MSRTRTIVVLSGAVAGLVLLSVGQVAIGAVVLAAAALGLVIGRGARYERRPRTSMWDALDAGEDPTADDD